MNKKLLSIMGSLTLVACGGGGSSSGGGQTPQPSPSPTPTNIMPTTTVYSSFNSGNPIPVASNKVINTVNPANNLPIYQLNSLNYGNNAISGNNTSWLISSFGNGTANNQNGLLDSNGNIDQVTNGVISIYSPSTWSLQNTYTFDSSVTLSSAIINQSATSVIGFNATGIYVCPINGTAGSCVLKIATNSLPKRVQLMNGILYASFVYSNGNSYVNTINLTSGNFTQNIINLTTPFQVDEFVPDVTNGDLVYVSALKSASIYTSIFKCTLSTGGCNNLYDNIVSVSDIYSSISADVSNLYFIRTQNNSLSLTYSIVKVNK